jgi:hypothetical protein
MSPSRLRPIASTKSGGRLFSQELTAASIGLTSFVLGDRFVRSDEKLLVGLDMFRAMLGRIAADVLFGTGRLRLKRYGTGTTEIFDITCVLHKLEFGRKAKANF